MEFSKVVHFSDEDLDGESCVILSLIAFADKIVDTRGVSPYTVNQKVNQFLDEELTTDMMVIITDVSVNEEVAQLIHEKVIEGHNIILIDHHKTALPLSEKYHWASVLVEFEGKKTCATSLYYAYLINNGKVTATPVLTDYVELVRSYDTWDWYDTNNYRANQLNMLLYLVGKDVFVREIAGAVQNKHAKTFEFTSFERSIISVEEKRIEEFEKKKLEQMKTVLVDVPEKEDPYRVGVVFAEDYQSTTGNFLCRSDESIDFVVMLDAGKGKISLRTIREDLDLAIIAKHYGGGGHPKSAGCPFNEQTLEAFVYPVLLSEW